MGTEFSREKERNGDLRLLQRCFLGQISLEVIFGVYRVLCIFCLVLVCQAKTELMLIICLQNINLDI